MIKMNLLKFLLPVLILIVLGFGALFGARYLQYRNSPEYQALQDLKKLEKAYAEDTYGGETPEETLRLFIDALKKGDTDLAAKYFVLDVQPERREGLAKIKEKGLLEEMVKDLEGAKRYRSQKEDRVFFMTGDTMMMEAVTTIDLIKLFSGWKIRDL